MPRGNQRARQWRLLHLLDRPAGVAVEAAAHGPAIGSAFDKISRVLSKDALVLIERMRHTMGARAKDV